MGGPTIDTGRRSIGGRTTASSKLILVHIEAWMSWGGRGAGKIIVWLMRRRCLVRTLLACFMQLSSWYRFSSCAVSSLSAFTSCIVSNTQKGQGSAGEGTVWVLGGIHQIKQQTLCGCFIIYSLAPVPVWTGCSPAQQHSCRTGPSSPRTPGSRPYDEQHTHAHTHTLN